METCAEFSLLKDLYKTQVIELSKWRNQNYLDLLGKEKNVIPNIIIKRAARRVKV